MTFTPMSRYGHPLCNVLTKRNPLQNSAHDVIIFARRQERSEIKYFQLFDNIETDDSVRPSHSKGTQHVRSSICASWRLLAGRLAGRLTGRSTSMPSVMLQSETSLIVSNVNPVTSTLSILSLRILRFPCRFICCKVLS